MNVESEIRLFVDAHVFDGRYQGTRTFIKEIYTLLQQKKGIKLFFGAADIDNLKLIFPPNENTFYVKYRSNSGMGRLLYDIPSILKKYNIEYAHFQYMCPRIKSCRYIVTIHDVIFNEYPDEFSTGYRLMKNFLYRISALKADIITTVSEYSKKSIQNYLSEKIEKIYIIPNGVSGKYFEAYDKDAAKNRIRKKFGIEKFLLMVSRIEPRKNHIFLLNAFIDLKLYDKGFHLVLLGHETIKVPEFENALAALPENIRRFIFIHEEIEDDILIDFYRAASVFVYPSRAEGFGIPPLEAGALQIPVICSNSSAMSDFSFFGEYHIDPTDYENFKIKLENITRNPPSSEELAAVSDIIKEKYSWSHATDELLKVIRNDKSRNFARTK